MTEPTFNTWEQQQYEAIFDNTVGFLEERRRTHPDFTPEGLRGMLKDVRFLQECDWLGNGIVFDIKCAAMVAAYEHVLAEWEAELRPMGGAK